MKFLSTRGGVTGLSFEDAILSGYAKDGGILLPESIPEMPEATLREWASLSYPELCKEILPIFIDDSEISKEEIGAIIDKSFLEFEVPEVVGLTLFRKGLHIGELYHGPTGAFKDLALSILGQCLELVLSRRKRRVTILVGTSGDTGSAAIRSVRGSEWANIIVLYPDKMVSEVQRLQMTTVDAPNVQVFAVEGTSDDLDVPIRNVFRDAGFVDKHQLCSINSINVGRVLFQCVHYVYYYLKLFGTDLDQVLPFYIPTGAAGHITAGCIARQLTNLDMYLVAAVNENDIMSRWLETGRFEARGDVIPTSSNAMDIQVPYNIERLLYYLSNGDCALVKKLMTDLETTGRFDMPLKLRQEAYEFMRGYSVDEGNRLSMMEYANECHELIICPHTATALRAAVDIRKHDSSPGVCLATATPAKFVSAVRKAGITAEVLEPASWSHLKTSKEHDKRMCKGEDWEALLRQAIEHPN